MKINEPPSAGMTRARDPGSARERVASPPAGTALAPQFGNASRTASEQWARFSLNVTKPVTIVNRSVTVYFPSPLAGEGGEGRAKRDTSRVRGRSLVRCAQIPHPPSLCSGTLSREGRGNLARRQNQSRVRSFWRTCLPITMHGRGSALRGPHAAASIHCDFRVGTAGRHDDFVA
jgi:hypothetical protein